MVRKKFGFGAFIATLFNPALLLVDHGHFQYNSVSLGLALIALCLGEYPKRYGVFQNVSQVFGIFFR